MNLFQRIVVHYATWFAEVKHQIGLEKAVEVLKAATARRLKIQMVRLSKTLGFELRDDLPAAVMAVPRESLLALMESVSANWLVNDGVWFQAVEFAYGMTGAKRCNDSAWARFSPFEASSIKRFLNLPVRPLLLPPTAHSPFDRSVPLR